MVLEWTLGLPTPGSIFSAAVSVYTSQGNMGDSEPPGESCACIIHTNLQSCMSIRPVLMILMFLIKIFPHLQAGGRYSYYSLSIMPLFHLYSSQLTMKKLAQTLTVSMISSVK